MSWNLGPPLASVFFLSLSLSLSLLGLLVAHRSYQSDNDRDPKPEGRVFEMSVEKGVRKYQGSLDLESPNYNIQNQRQEITNHHVSSVHEGFKKSGIFQTPLVLF